jgi:hypothetical protein
MVARGPAEPTAGPGPAVGFLDPETLQPLKVPLKQGQEVPPMNAYPARAAPDGSVFTFHDGTDDGQRDLRVLTFTNGVGELQSMRTSGLGYAVPGADGRLYTEDGVFSPRLTPVLQTNGWRLGQMFLPAAGGSVFLRLWRWQEASFYDRAQKQRPDYVTFHVGTQAQELARLEDVEGLETRADDNDRFVFGLDKRVHYVPAAKLFVTIPSTYDRLILRRCDLDKLLEQSGKDYLFVASEPPAEAVKGRHYAYAPDVKAKRGGVTVKLESGPPGMAVRDDRELTWDVPADFAEGPVDVVLAVKDAAGQEQFHRFSVTVRPAEAK